MKIQTLKKNNLEIQFICGLKKKHILVVSYHVFVKVRSDQVVWGTGFEILCPCVQVLLFLDLFPLIPGSAPKLDKQVMIVGLHVSLASN